MYQPQEQSSSRSCLQILEARGCLRHPASILAMLLLIIVILNFNNMVNDIIITDKLEILSITYFCLIIADSNKQWSPCFARTKGVQMC